MSNYKEIALTNTKGVVGKTTTAVPCKRGQKIYDYMLIDCMPSLGMITINALAVSDSVIMPYVLQSVCTEAEKR